MISAKLVATLALTSMGGFAGGTATYLETHPGVFIGRTEGHFATLLKVAPNRTAVHVVPAPAPHVVKLDPVLITTELHRPTAHAEAAMSIEGDTASNGVPCSGWQDLTMGPEGRKVRMLCEH
jgi:hypothetical protein